MGEATVVKLLGKVRSSVASIRFTALGTPRQFSETPLPEGVIEVIRKSAGREVGNGQT